MKTHLVEKFGKNVFEVNIVCLSNGIIYNDDKRIDDIQRPLQVMVGKLDRKIPSHLLTSLPDMILPDETEPRTRMSCGHAISKDEKKNLGHMFNLQTSCTVKSSSTYILCLLVQCNWLKLNVMKYLKLNYLGPRFTISTFHMGII